MTRRPAIGAIIAIGLVACAAVIVVGVASGSAGVSLGDAINVLAHHLLGADLNASPGADPIVWNIRMPRMLVAVVGGAVLGIAGAVLQGSMRSPLADSQLVGLSAVGSVGALAGYGVGYVTLGVFAGMIGGMVAGVLGAWLVWFLADRTGGEPSRFILVGIGTGLGLGALVAAASIAIHDPRIPDVTFWFFGGLNAATWDTTWRLSVVALVMIGGIVPFARALDVMSLGHGPARHAGVPVRLVLVATLGLVGLGVGATVGAFGVVGFVGLVGGRMAVSVVGPSHRRALPAAAFTGAVFLGLADIIGRVGGRGFEVPVGLVTTVIGGAYLIWLITARKVAV